MSDSIEAENAQPSDLRAHWTQRAQRILATPKATSVSPDIPATASPSAKDEAAQPMDDARARFNAFADLAIFRMSGALYHMGKTAAEFDREISFYYRIFSSRHHEESGAKLIASLIEIDNNAVLFETPSLLKAWCTLQSTDTRTNMKFVDFFTQDVRTEYQLRGGEGLSGYVKGLAGKVKMATRPSPDEYYL